MSSIVVASKYSAAPRRAVHGTYTSTRACGESTTKDLQGRRVQNEWLQCVHCQFIWKLELNSNRRRGFCQCCMGPTCGKWECERKCVPMERRLDFAQKWGNLALKRLLLT
jgi:hypothetical protein